MNDKIRELAEQAIDYAGGKPMLELKDRDLYLDNLFEKFAELIVQECIDTLSKRFMGDLNREDMEIRRCIEDVKKCFGVEECPNPNLIS